MLFSKAIIGKLCKDIEISYLVEMAQEVEKNGSFRKTFCKIIVRCGENVGKILYKNGLQVSVGHLRVPGAGVAKWVSWQICEIKLKFAKY